MLDITKIMASILDTELRKRGVILPRIRCEEIVERMIEATSNLDETIKTNADATGHARINDLGVSQRRQQKGDHNENLGSINLHS